MILPYSTSRNRIWRREVVAVGCKGTSKILLVLLDQSDQNFSRHDKSFSELAGDIPRVPQSSLKF